MPREDEEPTYDESDGSDENNFEGLRRPRSLPKNHSDSTTIVLENLECSVCYYEMYPPIYQCYNGHTICSDCKKEVQNQCPSCKQELGNIRCRALEKIAESLEVPCKYSSLGCPEIVPYSIVPKSLHECMCSFKPDKRPCVLEKVAESLPENVLYSSKLKHEAICDSSPYHCPFAGSGCLVVDNIPCLVAHLGDEHRVVMRSGCTFNHRYVLSNPHEVENDKCMLTVLNCYGHDFCIHFEAFQRGMAPIYMAFLRFMGDETEAKNYSYSLEVKGNFGKHIFEGTPRSIRDSHMKVRDSYDGLIIQRDMALFFSGGGLKLAVTGKIWEKKQNPDEGQYVVKRNTLMSQDGVRSSSNAQRGRETSAHVGASGLRASQKGRGTSAAQRGRRISQKTSTSVTSQRAVSQDGVRSSSNAQRGRDTSAHVGASGLRASQRGRGTSAAQRGRTISKRTSTSVTSQRAVSQDGVRSLSNAQRERDISAFVREGGLRPSQRRRGTSAAQRGTTISQRTSTSVTSQGAVASRGRGRQCNSSNQNM